MNTLLPFLPFVLAFLGIRCMLGMWETARAKNWESFARWSMGVFASGAAAAVVSLMLGA